MIALLTACLFFVILVRALNCISKRARENCIRPPQLELMMLADKYASTLPCQMEAIVYLLFLNCIVGVYSGKGGEGPYNFLQLTSKQYRNDPLWKTKEYCTGPRMIPVPQMIPKLDPQMIPIPETYPDCNTTTRHLMKPEHACIIFTINAPQYALTDDLKDV